MSSKRRETLDLKLVGKSKERKWKQKKKNSQKDKDPTVRLRDLLLVGRSTLT
jgi:hypothetical protein